MRISVLRKADARWGIIVIFSQMLLWVLFIFGDKRLASARVIQRVK